MTPSGQAIRQAIRQAMRQPNGRRTAYVSLSRKSLDGFVSGPYRIGHKPEIDESRQIAIALWNLCCCRCVLDDGDLKSLLQQLVHVCLYTQIGRHPCKQDLIDMLFSQLQHEVILLGAVHLVRRCNYSLTVK